MNNVDLLDLQLKCGLNDEQKRTLFVLGSKSNPNYYASYVSILVEGYSSLGKTITVSNDYHVLTINKETYNQFINKDNGILKNCELLQSALKRSPAGKAGQLEDLGKLGSHTRLAGYRSVAPGTGPGSSLPHWAADTLSSSNNSFLNGLNQACDAIHSRAWLNCFSAGNFGGIRQCVHYISGAVRNFYEAMYDLYQGISIIAMQAQIIISYLIKKIQNFLRDRFIQGTLQMILAVLCAILSIAQSILDDIGFFASLFGGSDSLFQALNSIQTVVNFGSDAIDIIMNPITSGLPALFPKQAKQLMTFIESIGKLPDQLLGNFLKAIKLNTLFNNKALATINTIVKHYGLGAQLGDIGTLLDQFGTVKPKSNWHRSYSSASKIRPRFHLSLTVTVDPRFRDSLNGLIARVDGTPLFDLKGQLNNAASLFDFKNNPATKNFFYHAGAVGGNIQGFIDTLRGTGPQSRFG